MCKLGMTWYTKGGTCISVSTHEQSSEIFYFGLIVTCFVPNFPLLLRA